MARINIEDSIWMDRRFINLYLKMTSVDEALGVLVRSWILAQKWYLKSPNRLIPYDDWQKQLLPDALFEVGLAVRVDNDWIKVAGADEQFSWLLQKVEAGKKGGISKRDKRDNRAKHTLADVSVREHTLADASTTKPLPPSPSPSPSPSRSQAQVLTQRDIVKVSADALPELALLWNEFSDSSLPKVKEMRKSSKRYKSCQARWEDNPDRSYWTEVIKKLNQSPFCLGSKGWRADIEFLCRPDSATKILEGKYDSPLKSGNGIDSKTQERLNVYERWKAKKLAAAQASDLMEGGADEH